MKAEAARERRIFAAKMMSQRFMVSIFCVSLLSFCGCSAQPPQAAIPFARPTQERAVVIDIDGTLTPKIHAINSVRPDAVEAVNMLAAKGYLIIYLSARVRALAAGIPDWLRDNGFPEGNLQLSQSREDRRHPADFKAGILARFSERGWSIEYAYGDSSTDFEAYAAARIPKEHVFALRREGRDSCQPGEWNSCLAGWTEHLNFIRQFVPPVPVS